MFHATWLFICLDFKHKKDKHWLSINFLEMIKIILKSIIKHSFKQSCIEAN